MRPENGWTSVDFSHWFSAFIYLQLKIKHTAVSGNTYNSFPIHFLWRKCPIFTYFRINLVPVFSHFRVFPFPHYSTVLARDSFSGPIVSFRVHLIFGLWQYPVLMCSHRRISTPEYITFMRHAMIRTWVFDDDV